MADDLFNSMLGDVAGARCRWTSLMRLTRYFLACSMRPKAGAKPQRHRGKTGHGGSADKYAEHLGIAQSLGVPVDFVGRNEKELKEFKGFTDIRRMMDNKPAAGQVVFRRRQPGRDQGR